MWIVTKEAVIAIVRTAVAYLYAMLLSQIPTVDAWLTGNGFDDELQTFVSGAFVVFAGTLVYAGIRSAAEKWPQVGYLLVFNTKPKYDEGGE